MADSKTKKAADDALAIVSSPRGAAVAAEVVRHDCPNLDGEGLGNLIKKMGDQLPEAERLRNSLKKSGVSLGELGNEITQRYNNGTFDPPAPIKSAAFTCKVSGPQR